MPGPSPPEDAVGRRRPEGAADAVLSPPKGIAMEPARSVRRLRGALRVVAALFLGAALVYGLGPVLGSLPLAGRALGDVEPLFRELPFVANSVVKVTVLGLCCLYAAGDLRRRHGLVAVVIAAHLVSMGAMAALLLAGEAEGSVALGGGAVSASAFLLAATALDGVVTLVLVALYLPARLALGRASAARGERSSGDAGALTGAERRLRGVLWALAAVFAAAAVAYEAGPLLEGYRGFFVELPFVTNSVVKVALLAMVCAWIARDLRSRMGVLYPVLAGHAVSVLVLAAYLVGLPADGAVRLGAWRTDVAGVLGAGLALDGAVFAGLLLLTQRAWTERYGLSFLRPIEFRTLVALAEVLIRAGDPSEEEVPPADVARNVDRYVSQIRARRRWVHRAALFGIWLHPLLVRFRAPISELDPRARLRYLKEHFQRAEVLDPIPEREPPPPPLAVVQRFAAWVRKRVPAMIRVAQQLTYVGYYNDPRSFASVGYERFSERDRHAELERSGEIPERTPHPLDVREPDDVGELEIEADVCIVGTGAAGSVLAYHLAERGREVLMLERGRYVEPREFTEDEVEMMGKLYADGMFQQTDDFRFTILQGSCVGGSTVVNNAVCFDPPEPVLRAWNDPQGPDAGLHLPTLRRHVDEVSELISVQRQLPPDPPERPDGVKLNPSADLLLRGADRLDLEARGIDVDVVRANIDDCLGCGYCNIGCAYGKKLSMLYRVLPEAQERFPGRVRIMSECEVDRLVTRTGPVNRVDRVLARLSDGRRLEVGARDVVSSAGAVASPHLLLRSGVGRDLPVGRRASFNMGAALTAEFDRPLDAYDGLQISHYVDPGHDRGWVMETWWNPPVAQAINMPGWFERHFRNMRRYDRMMAVGVLVGTRPGARIGWSWLGGPAVHYTPAVEDLRTMADGLKPLGRILFEAGAERVMANTWGHDEFTHPDELERLDRIALDPGYLTLGSGHPQGGCPMSRDPGKGVVGPDFRVHGYDNLHVCDASVFPGSTTVNPQLTVMSLARYAADAIR